MRKLFMLGLLLVPARLMAGSLWTANITNVQIVEKSPGQRLTDVTIDFTNGTTAVKGVIFESLQASTTTVSNFCKQKIAQYETLDFLKPTLTIGPVDLTDTPPTPEELTRNKFVADFSRLEILKRLMDAGVTNAKADYDALLITVNGGYKTAYVP